MIDKRLYPAGALHGRVAHEIGRRIASGAIAEGALLPRESELAANHNVSRQAIREALKVLAAKGLVVSRRRAGTHVTSRQSWNLLDPDVLAWHPAGSLDPDFLKDLVELRRLIEPAAAEFAATRGERRHIDRITAATDRMREVVEANDAEAYDAADVEFHSAVFSASGNILIERLSSILGPLYEVSFRLQRQAGGTLEQAMAVHAAVHDAIVAGDGRRARRAMETILTYASSEIATVTVHNPPTG